jgi:hypothetical protein
MTKRILTTVIALLIGSLAGSALGQENYAIGSKSAGNLKLGMTVSEARKAMPGFTFKRTSDGEGLALIAVEKAGDTHMVLFAGEDDPDSKIDDTAKVEYIEVFSPKYKTPEGLSPRMKLAQAEKISGKITEIILSEIESREYATFENGGKEYSVRLMNENGMAGVYANASNTTTKYAPGAYIFSIGIDGGPRQGDLEESPEVGLKQEDIAATNKMISEAAAKNEAWTKSAEQVALKIAGEFSETSERAINVKADSAEDPDRLTITVTDDGYLDDSVRGMKQIMIMERDRYGVWKLTSYSKGWRCWSGRGHDDYSAKPCL